MRTAKRILAEFMTVVMVLQACSPTVAAVAAGWQNISSEIATAAAEASDTAESGETKSDVTTGSGSSDTGAAGDSAEDDAAKDDTATGDTSDSAAGSDSVGDQTEGDDTAGDAAADDAEQNADAEASEDAAAQADATITNLDDLVQRLKDNGAQNIDPKEDNSGIESLEVTNSSAFAVLSNADAQFYHDAQIGINLTGELPDLTLKAENNTLSFQGLGSDAYPFDGKIYDVKAAGGDDSVKLKTDRTVFNSLKLTNQNNTVKIKWVGATNYSAPMVASKISGENMTLNATVDIDEPLNANGSDTTSALTAPLLGETTGNLAVEVAYSLSGSRKNLNVSADGNIGLIANIVESGTLTVESVTLPNDLVSGGTVETSSGNAGLLVGEVKDGATLSVGTLENVRTATVQSTSGCAGGVVGLVGSSAGATVNVKEALDLQTLTVKGTTASGGLIGKATKLTLGTDNKKFTCPANVGDKTSQSSGGFIGEVSFASSVEFTNNDQIHTGAGVNLGQSGDTGAGGVFGLLDTTNGDVKISGGSYTSKLVTGSNSIYGGLVGRVQDVTNTAKPNNTLHIKTDAAGNRCSVDTTCSVAPQLAGGLVGWVAKSKNTGGVVIVDGADVTCHSPQVTGKNCGFGGVVGALDSGYSVGGRSRFGILDCGDVRVETDENESIACGAGIVGSAWNGVLRLRGTTDLSDCKLEANGNTSQILRSLDGSAPLVFALGSGSDTKTTNDYWLYKRPAAAKIDDLTYNQVIRLTGETGKLSKNLIKLDKSTFYQPLCNLRDAPDAGSSAGYSWGNQLRSQDGDGRSGSYLIKDADTFACIAMMVQTHGYFGGVFGVGTSNLKDWYGNNGNIFSITSNIDLRGTGLEGLACDGSRDVKAFGGAVEGNQNTVTLAIGEPYGTRNGVKLSASDSSEGNGKIYRHSRLGLFNAIGGGATANDPTATVNNLTIDGVMKFDNGLAVDAGSLAATITGNATLSGVTCKSTITCDDTFEKDVNIGGIAGSVSGAGTVTFDSGSTKAQATVKTGATLNGNMRIGGAIGYVADVAAIISVASLEVGDATASKDAITAGDSVSKKIAQVGGFIGCIVQGSQEKKVNITGLSFNSFNMSVGKNGDAKNGAGGLLGYSWGNTVVTFGDRNINKDANPYALKTNNASITAGNSEELGGLVYAASGHWIINDYAIDLSGATINAEKATTLGLLVGRGSKVNTKDSSSSYGSEPYTGLYLEDRAFWETAYRVPNGENAIVAPNVTIFDEWVGNGVKQNSKLMDGEWNTVVSLHTQADTLDMSGNKGRDNSYKNRSAFGESHKTNQYVRYYYNLDRAYNNMRSNGGKYTSALVHLTTPQELLLWSACRYAPADIRKYVAPEMTGESVGLNSSQVYIDGGNSSDQNTIDLSGYSYYPAEPGGNVYVQNVNIKFCYSNIKSEYANNKSNAAGTQHENMHCGLLRTMNANLTVENVTLGGTIGIAVNDGDTNSGGTVSGALVCRYIYGSSTSVKQISIDGLTLNGLTVDGVTDTTTYAPLLINEMQTYVKLDAKKISTTTGYAGGTKAATSLFGKLGVGGTADQVTATFSLINLPSAKDNTIFTRASLLESFGYGQGKTGSAVYTFFKDDQTNNKVTFGSEIDSKGEYPGKQLWYYDEDTYEKSAGLVTVDGKQANRDTPQFGDYLPYVKRGRADDETNNVQYHEIKVNQRVPKLTVGCGTYGDPYAITKTSELNTVAEYINTQNARDGWEVTIAKDQEQLCQRRNGGSTNSEITYVYKQSNAANKKWEKKDGDTTSSSDTLDDDTMRRYLQSAYYSIEPAAKEDGAASDVLELDAASFQGLGNQGNPFRGVIVGNLRGAQKADLPATIKIKNTGSTSAPKGLIPYSYGSVVSNLNIEYSGNKASIKYESKDSKDSSSGVPGAFFGGVIGCIMGGDNIIDGVSVKASGGFSVTGDSHLVPVGGYVGAIAGGGVIFRNSLGGGDAPNDWRWHGAGASLYNNPFVGRVIDGYAFSELASGKSLDNTDRNYKVNNLNTDDKQCIVTDDTQNRYRGDANKNAENLAITTTVKDSQGLLVLSAIISSGAAGGSANTTAVNDLYGTYAGSRAYLGGNTSKNTKYQFGNQNYGKVRNASYKYVGQPASAATDFDIAVKDDRLSPGSQDAGVGALDQTDDFKVNSPYLVSKYATWQTGNICAAQASGIDLRFVNTVKNIDPVEDIDYDMTPYGTGYTGLSGRYYSNACASDKGADRDRIVPLIATINGDGATVRVGSKASQTAYDIKEYIDDDYKLTGVGALFGTVTYTSKNVSGSIADNNDCTVQNLKFDDCNISLGYVSYSKIATVDNNIATVATDSTNEVGVGLLAGTTANANSLESYGKYSAVDMTKCSVNGPTNVGGLIGTSGYGARSTDKSDTTSIVNQTGKQPSPVELYDCSYDGMTVSGGQNTGGFVGKLNAGSQGGVWTTKDKSVAKDSTIESTSSGSRVGGIIGVNGDAVYVNTDPASKEPTAGGKATIKNVALRVPANAGASGGVGGFIGKAEKDVYAHKLVVTSDATTKSIFGAPSSDKLKNVGGIAGNITGGSEFRFDSCEVSNIDFESREVSGGISGNISNAPNVTCNNVVISGNNFNSSYAGGINGSLGNAPTFNIANTVIKNNVFVNRSNAWEGSPQGNNARSRSGGLGGDGRGVYRLSNALFDSNDFQGKNGQGVFFGDAKSGLKIYAAGIDIKPGNGKARDDLPPLLFDTTTNQSTVKQINRDSYVAFADYKDTLDEPGANTTLYSDDDASGNETVAVSPYVTMSPMSKIAVRVSNADPTDRYLFGDGANVGTAAAIKTEAGKPVADRYTYTNIGGSNDSGEYQNDASGFVEKSSVGTFNGNNESKKVAEDKDFDVLVLSGGDTTTVESYLNIVTNGGYSDAKRLNSSTPKHVTANIETFTLDANNRFVRDENPTPTVSIESKDTSQMKFRASGTAWDNEKGRFNLLTVTFTEAEQSYKVQVPIIVKRKLEIDFSATYDYGTNFKESNYANLGDGAHVLTSFGEPMTGLLTWTYNSAKGTEVDFGWDSYMAAGGSMKGLGKSILFDGANGRLPQGTQLTLVDANVDGKAGGREYHYEVGEGGATSVSLSGNDGFKDSSNPAKAYQERWLSEILGVSAAKDGAGTWVACDSEAEATAKAKFKGKWTLFKVADADVPSDERYTLTVPKDNEGKEQRASESVYLVVNVPKPSVDGTRANINGFTGTSIDSGSSGNRISWSLHHVLRANGHNDSHSNTASTYGILSNYRQEVNDGKSEARTPVSKSTDGAAYVLSLDVTDTITFNPSQNYADSDSLFYQLDTSLCKYGTNDNLTGVSSFPSGTSAIAKFYVAIGDQNYRWNGNDWETCDASTPAFTQTVMDTGNDSLKLMLDHDLAGIRKRATGGSFTVRTVVEEIRLTPDGCNKVIALSQQSGEDAYTKMSYTAKLSTRKEGLNTSSLTQTKRGYVGYYRMDKGDTTITLSAPEKSQLGINVDDLRPIANGTIGLGATYELGGLNNATEAIKNADSVVYTLTLRRRSGIDGSYESVTDDISNYVTVTESKLATVSDTGNAITFTDTKKDGVFGTKNGDTTFNLPFTVKVNTQAEQSEQFYANYRLVMTASLVTGGVASAMPQSPDYVTYTLTRVNLNGIDH